MAGTLLQENGSKILSEDLKELGQARKVDYKFKYIFNRGTTTDVYIRWFEGSGNYTRNTMISEYLDTLQGNLSLDEIRTHYNSLLIGYGTPIPEQT